MSTHLSGIVITQQTTLREYLESIGKTVPEVYAKLAELTELTEKVLYSDNEPDEKMAERAEQLAKEIVGSYKF